VNEITVTGLTPPGDNSAGRHTSSHHPTGPIVVRGLNRLILPRDFSREKEKREKKEKRKRRERVLFAIA
jgi:hypothetical protein